MENNFGKDGPYISASNNPTLQPNLSKDKAKFVAKVDFPTPPFALEIAIVNLVPLIGFFTKVFGFIALFSTFYHINLNSTYLVFKYKDTI